MIDLEVADIEWILSAFIQANLICEAAKTIINMPVNQFQNFNPPHLRGILAQTATSIRLAEHQ